MKKRNVPYKLILLGSMVPAGILLHQLGWFDWHMVFERGEQYAHSWWFAPALIAFKIVLYMFAFPGSMLIWIASLFFNPVVATTIIVAGGVGGAVAAYGFTRRMSADVTHKIESSRFFKVLSKHTDFATLCAVRVLPNFPHSVINYGAGILGVPLPRFIASSLLGFAVKGYLYASMIRNAAKADSLSEIFDLKTLGPLFILAGLFMIGKLIQRYGRTTGQG